MIAAGKHAKSRVFHVGRLSAHYEVKRRTKPMEIVAGENSVYTLLAFVAMKMEVLWRNAPFRNSDFRKLKPLAIDFTHES